jgi:hypothetical protein
VNVHSNRHHHNFRPILPHLSQVSGRLFDAETARSAEGSSENPEYDLLFPKHISGHDNHGRLRSSGKQNASRSQELCMQETGRKLAINPVEIPFDRTYEKVAQT